MPRLGVARLHFAGNSFNPIPTTRDAFLAGEWATGPGALERHQGLATGLGGVLTFLDDREGWEAEVFRCAAALPGGPLEDSAFEEWLGEVEAAVADADIDGLYLSLHGACLTASEPEADLLAIRRLRAALGPERPLVASFEARANLSPQVATLLDGASAGRGMDAAARRALRLLERRQRGLRAEGVVVRIPRLPPPGLDLAEAWRLAWEAERDSHILDASPLAGFPWGDGPWAGAGAMVWAEQRDAARDLARRLAAAVARCADAPPRASPAPDEARRLALAAPPGPVLLLDPSDDPLSGGLCDTPGLLRSLLGTPAETVLAALHDPDAVAAARAAGEGARLSLTLGARLAAGHGAPVPFEGVVERLTPGRFLREGPELRGGEGDAGPTAMLRAGMLRVILTSRREAMADPAFLALHRIHLGELRVLALKAGEEASAMPGFSAVVVCDAPGPASPHLAALPFRHLPKGWQRG